MKKITFFFMFLWGMSSVSAQFTYFDSTQSPEQGDFAVGDINNDGYVDVIFSGRDYDPLRESGAVMINNGDGTFTKQVGTKVVGSGHFGKIAFGDIDGDGDLDVIFTGNDGGAKIALNDGTGIFTLTDNTAYPKSSGTISCGFADFNNDGLLDYFFFGNGKGAGVNSLFYQQADGSFTTVAESFNSFGLTDPDVTVLDFNNDGYLDIFINAWLNDPVTVGDKSYKSGRFSAIFLNDGTGHFIPMDQPNVIMKGFGSAAWGDIDGDGWLDLLLIGHAGGVAAGPTETEGDLIARVYKNNQGVLEAKAFWKDYNSTGPGNRVKIVDWNNDGKLDIILGGWRPSAGKQATDFYICDDAANFTFVKDETLSNSSVPRVSDHMFELADLNGDGKVDLMMMGWSGNYNRRVNGYYLNETANASTTPHAPITLNQQVNNEGDVEFSWVTPSSEAGKGGTTYNVALKNKTTGKWLYNPMAIVDGAKNGQRLATGMGNVYTNTSWTIKNLSDGEYEWTVQAINGAFIGGEFAKAESFKIEGGTVSLENTSSFDPKVSVYNNKVVINGEGDSQLIVKIYNLNGLLVTSTSFVSDVEINLSEGFYLVKVEAEGAKALVEKVIIQ